MSVLCETCMLSVSSRNVQYVLLNFSIPRRNYVGKYYDIAVMARSREAPLGNISSQKHNGR